MLVEFSKLERKVYKISSCAIFPASSSPQCHKYNIGMQAKKTNSTVNSNRSS